MEGCEKLLIRYPPSGTMGSSQNESILSEWRTACADVVFDHIERKLLQAELITRNDFQKIKCQHTDHEKLDLLLDILFKKGSKVCNSFLDVLREDYPWVVDALKEKVVSIETEPAPKISRLSVGLTTEMMCDVQRNYHVAEKWTLLAHELGLSRHITDIRVRVHLHGEVNSMCVLYLLQEWVSVCSHQATLGQLVQVLRTLQMNDIADELNMKYG